VDLCPVCGEPFREDDPPFEEERFVGLVGAEMKVSIPYCDQGEMCNAVAAANLMERMADEFHARAGRG
jgi:hypothetical protein